MNPSTIPIPRPRPPEKRESLLRASILDTALELGVGTSKTVTHWMFNPIGEDDEERDVRIIVVIYMAGFNCSYSYIEHAFTESHIRVHSDVRRVLALSPLSEPYCI